MLSHSFSDSKDGSPKRKEEPGFAFQKITNMGSEGRNSLKKSLTVKSEKIDFSKDKPISTELVIEKMLLYEAGDDEDLDDWNMLDSDLDSE
jgi:hypothetical protein